MTTKQKERIRRYLLNEQGARKARASGGYHVSRKPFKMRIDMQSYAEFNRQKRLGLRPERHYRDVLRFPIALGLIGFGAVT